MNPVNQEATQFIYNVKERFRNQPSKFNEFAQVVSDISTWIRLGRNCDNLVYKLKDMFDNDDHRDLIFGLNQFLADRYQPSVLKLQQDDDDMFEKDGPFKLMPHDEFFYRIYDRCVEKNDVDFDVLTKFSDTIISYQVRKIDFHEADKIFRNIFRDDPDLYVESTHVMSSRVVEDSSGSSILDFLKRGGKKQSIIVEKKWSLYEEVMMLKEYNLCELDIWLGPMGSLAEKLENSPEKLEEALTDIRMIKTLYSSRLEVQ